MLKKIVIPHKNPKNSLEIFEIPERKETKDTGLNFDLANNQMADVAKKIAEKRQNGRRAR